jgi:ABC-type amino acid transport system permease subunit
VITVVEILRTAQLQAARDFKTFEMYLTAAVCYLALTTVITAILGKVESRLALKEGGANL